MPFSAVIFDCAGVVIDCSFHQFVAWRRMFEEEGASLTMTDFQTKISGRIREEAIREVLGNDLSDERLEELSNRKQEIFDQFIALDMPGSFPGIVDILTTLRERGVKLCVASASRNAAKLLNHAKVSQYFDAVVTPSSHSVTSSEKDLYTLSLKELGVQLNECIVVEDTPLSIAVAKKMGIFTVGITVMVPASALADADRVVADHNELRKVLCSEFFPLSRLQGNG